MAALAVIPAPAETAPAPYLVDRARAYISSSRAASTLRGYRADMRDFRRFCARHGLCAMPADAATVASYLSACADSGRLKAGSIQRRVSAIAAAHVTAGHESPTLKAAVRLCVAGIRRQLGVRQEGKAPTLTSDIAAMLSHLPAGLLGIRDRALLLAGFAGAFRRSELVGLNVEDLTFGDDGLKVLIRHSKTDQEGEGQVIGIARGVSLCPVAALQAWLAAAGIASGPVFRPVNRHGHVKARALSGQVVALVVKRYAAAAGLDASKYAGHSLRAGLVTQAAINGVSELCIMKTTRHKSSAMVQRYVRDANLFRDNASARVGL
jgi:site-specific recombinase XerD